MPSSFPGMDPYLERPRGWLNVHNRLTTYLADDLTPRLLPRYIAATTQYVYVEVQDRGIYPDVFIARPDPATAGGVSARGEADSPVVVHAPAAEVREGAVHILEAGTGRVVTVIEIASPSNKARKGPAREIYDQKHEDLRASDAHLVEIDLLRGGERHLSVPAALLERLDPFHYLVCVQRSSDRTRFELYPATIRTRLPRFAVPLLPGDPDIVLDLQAVFELLYDRGAFARTVSYREGPPPPPFSAEDAASIDGLLRSKGLRP